MQPISCPYCRTQIAKLNDGGDSAFHGLTGRYEQDEIDSERQRIGLKPTQRSSSDFGIRFGFCPLCDGFIVAYYEGIMYESIENFNDGRGYTPTSAKYVGDFIELHKTTVIYPVHGVVPSIVSQIPERYRADFTEATLTLAVSPRASATLSRRLLEHILVDDFGLKEGKLCKKIDRFLEIDEIPKLLRDEVDAVRNIGNFAAHPMKDDATGQIADVEPGEAEWSLSTVEALLRFVFIERPANEERVRKLDNKLQELGQKPIKKPKE